jgi:hypothetical protein
MRARSRVLPVVLVALALPSTALAKPTRTVAPPGDSGLSQYLEVVPTAQGPSPPGVGGPGSGGHAGALTTSQQRQLNALGPSGRTLVGVVEATAPQSLGVPVASRAATRSAGSVGVKGSAKPGEAAAGGESVPAAGLPSVSGSSPVSLVLGTAIGRGGGVGLWLPAFILASLAAVTTLAVVRRRRTVS